MTYFVAFKAQFFQKFFTSAFLAGSGDGSFEEGFRFRLNFKLAETRFATSENCEDPFTVICSGSFWASWLLLSAESGLVDESNIESLGSLPQLTRWRPLEVLEGIEVWRRKTRLAENGIKKYEIWRFFYNFWRKTFKFLGNNKMFRKRVHEFG